MSKYKFRSWPFKKALPEAEYKAVEGAEVPDREDQLKKVIDDLVGMVISHPMKKSGAAFVSQDDLNNFAKDAGVSVVEDEEYKSFKPDKKMNMVKVDGWKTLLIKPFKGKKAPKDDVIADIIAKMSGSVEGMKKNLQAAIEKRAAEDLKLKKMNKFFDACKYNKPEDLESGLAAEPWVLNVRHPQKGNSTPIMVATRNKQMDVVKWLIEKKCDLSIEDSFNWTALNWASEDSLDDFVKVLEDAGCPMGAGDEESEEEESDGDFHVADAIS
eukprot:CAMPEP_0197524748 /NCGR_PEP_ID=MMETSP1318-20131121/9754_1 /TAXON_ID=552666 /ORGANISM="Partenskyella glossopodia, Strain RCC365" /LENGTH=269 /DNA_ID=CAMNT_0043077769 /DNA_START=63 /DNA_END=872 /DNA_ORIENTATION=+